VGATDLKSKKQKCRKEKNVSSFLFLDENCFFPPNNITLPPLSKELKLIFQHFVPVTILLFLSAFFCANFMDIDLSQALTLFLLGRGNHSIFCFCLLTK